MPLLWLSLAFLLGVLLGEWAKLPAAGWLAFALLTAGLDALNRGLRRFPGRTTRAAAWWRRFQYCIPQIPESLRAPLPFSVLLVALCLGATRYQVSLPDIAPGYIAWYNDGEGKVTVEGLVVAPPDVRDEYTNLQVRAERLHQEGEFQFTPVDGELLARLPPGGDWRYGDRVRLWGYLETPGENEIFSYRGYLSHQGVYSQLDCGACLTCEYTRSRCARLLAREQGNPLLARIYALRERSLDTLYALFPDPEASLLKGAT